MSALTITINASPEILQALNSLTSAITNIVGMPAQHIPTGSTPINIALQEQPQSLVNPPVVTSMMPTQQVPQQVTHQPQLYSQTAAPIPQVNPATPIAPPVTQQQQPMQSIPTTLLSYTIDQLAVAATQLVDAGRREELVALLNAFGVQALTALPKEQFGTFAMALRERGVKI